jgi:hypothetical protein
LENAAVLITAMAVSMNGTLTEKPDGWVNGAFKPIWDRGRGYSNVVLCPGDMLALGGVCILVITPGNRSNDVLPPLAPWKR